MDVMKSFSLVGKTAWVTGASHGIGFAIASALAEAGAEVAFNERHADKLEKGSAAYKEAGLDVRPYLCDVTYEAD